MRIVSFGLFTLIASFTFQVLAADIPYVRVETCDYAPYASPRDYWEQTKTFCYIQDQQQIKIPLSSMGEIKLRDKGHDVASEYLNALSAENRSIVSSYRTYFVRYLGLNEAKPGQNQSFVVHVFYRWGLVTQTIYAFGEIDPAGEVKLTAFADSEAGDRDYRIAYSVLRNLFTGNNATYAGTKEKEDEDRRRIQPAKDVVRQFLKSTKPLPELPLPRS